MALFFFFSLFLKPSHVWQLPPHDLLTTVIQMQMCELLPPWLTGCLFSLNNFLFFFNSWLAEHSEVDLFRSRCLS